MRNRPERSTRSRPMTLLGCMIVVAAIALGLVGWIALRKGAAYRGNAYYLTPSRFHEWVEFLGILALPLSWAVVALSVARGPRLDRRRWASRPGFVACLTIVVASVAQWLTRLPCLMFVNIQLMSYWQTALWSYLPCSWPPNLAPALLAAWLVLWTGRRWRPEPDWVDGLGRGLGAFTLVLAILGSFTNYY